MTQRNHVLPVAWFVASSSTADSLIHFFDAVTEATKKLHPEFCPGSIHTDDDKAEHRASRYFF
jgi:hypothetical protein